jgi:hypothetical protein
MHLVVSLAAQLLAARWMQPHHRRPCTTLILFTWVCLLNPQAKSAGGLVDGVASVDELVEQADGFAEVFPEHKYEIVDILQKRNHMVRHQA